MRTYGRPFRRLVRGIPGRYYYVKVRDGGHVTWRSTGAETLGRARKVVAAWMRDDATAGPVSSRTFMAVVDMWLGEKASRMGKGYQAVYRSYANQWRSHFGATRLRDVMAADLDTYLRIRLARGLAARTVNDERSAFRAFFAWCQDAGLVRSNPARLVPKFPERRRRVATLAPDQEKRLLRAAEGAGERVYGLVLCLTHSGLRRGTAARVAWRDVDWGRGEWKIPAEKVKSRQPYVGRPISEELMAWLIAHRPKATRQQGEPIFGRLKPADWRIVVQAADLPWLKPHDLRRNFVTRCRRAGVPLDICMWLSDHRDLRTVLECYREVDTDEARDALRQAFPRAE